MATTTRTVEVALGSAGVDEHGRAVRTPMTVTENGAVSTLEPPPLPPAPESQGEHMLINIGLQHPAATVWRAPGARAPWCDSAHSATCLRLRIGEYRAIQPDHDHRQDYQLDRQCSDSIGERLFGVEVPPRCTCFV